MENLVTITKPSRKWAKGEFASSFSDDLYEAKFLRESHKSEKGTTSVFYDLFLNGKQVGILVEDCHAFLGEGQESKVLKTCSVLIEGGSVKSVSALSADVAE